jgi:multidrug efflux pump subunit AcrA (membrane-fusion protein)
LAPAHTGTNRTPLVEVVAVEPRTEATGIIGYGTVRPGTQLQIVPMVSGRVIDSHPNLAPGNIISKGDRLYTIDPTVYEARVRQSKAEVAGLESALGRHEREASVLDRRIETAEKMLAIDEADHRSAVRLLEESHIGAQRDVDLLLQKLLRTRDALDDLKNLRARIPELRIETQAQLDAARARLSLTEFELRNTIIECPFRARVESVQGRTAQVVAAFTPIALLTDVEVLEIPVGLDAAQLRWLHGEAKPETVNDGTGRSIPDVKVVWSAPGQDVAWAGRVSRFERFDEVTRTARMIVEVRPDDSSRGAGVAAELSIGMFCRVEFPAAPLCQALVVPRTALYEEQWVYIVVPEGAADGGRLERRRISPLRMIGDEVLVNYEGARGPEPCELAAGDLVVVSPLIKPVIGRTVRTVLASGSTQPTRITSSQSPNGGTQ